MSINEARKIALITGAGQGIGGAIAKQLAIDGFYVILVARKPENLKKVLSDIETSGGAGHFLLCDVCSQEDVNKMITSIDNIDVLVNNAGRGGGGHTTQMDDNLWHAIISTNLHSVYYVSKGILAKNKLNRPGTIINISSTGGKQGVVYAAAYSASKHGVIGFTKSLGLELAKKDITVNAICPGFVETPMAKHVREKYGEIWQISAEEAKTRIEDRIPLGRYINPEEVAALASYLSSPKARGITAQAINVCGGLGNY